MTSSATLRLPRNFMSRLSAFDPNYALPTPETPHDLSKHKEACGLRVGIRLEPGLRFRLQHKGNALIVPASSEEAACGLT